jgi:hypothetical protein
MAEETKTTTEATNAPEVDYKAKFEEMETKYSNLKTSFDKASSDVAEYKRKERERMSEDEKKAATEAEREAHYKELERKIRLGDYSAELDDITDVKMRNEISELFADGKITEALKKFKDFRTKDRVEMEKRIKAELMKQDPTPSAQSSSGTAKTKADILAIADYELRQQAIAQNIHLFQ